MKIYKHTKIQFGWKFKMINVILNIFTSFSAEPGICFKYIRQTYKSRDPQIYLLHLEYLNIMIVFTSEPRYLQSQIVESWLLKLPTITQYFI